MKILLSAVNAKYIHSNPAVYSLKAYAGEYGDNFQLEIAEYTINQQKDEILGDLFLRRPDVLCFSCYIWNISYVKELIGDISKVLPDTIIWVGGPEVSYHALEFLEECSQVTGVMVGEGEATFPDVARHYQDNKPDLANISGIVYTEEKEGERILRQNPPRERLKLSAIPFAYETLQDFRSRIIYYESSRGCPFSCSYCLSSVDKKLRFRDLELVKKELRFFIDHQVPQVKFVDRTFNCDHNRTISIWDYIREQDNGITNFHFEVAADLFTEEELDLIGTMRPGLIQLEIGVQSTNPKTLSAIRRQMDFEKVSQAVHRIGEGKNVHQHLDLIAGLPYEDYESFGRSFNEVYTLKPNQLQLGFLKILKGSYMQEMVNEYQCSYQCREPYEVLKTKWLSYEDILRLKGICEMVEIYYNSGQYSRTLPVIEKIFPTPFAFYEAMAAFYKERGYFAISHSRLRRYEILLEFLELYKKEELEYYKEMLVLDLYLRENVKSRPSWAKDMSVYREYIHDFYRTEEKAPRYLTEYTGYQARQLSKMTHVEVFQYPVLQQGRGESYVLFDYKKRDPLTHNADVYIIK